MVVSSENYMKPTLTVGEQKAVTRDLLSHGYRRLFPVGKSCRHMKLNTHLHPMRRTRELELFLHSCRCLHGIDLN
jgi:hypothetical protein